MALSPLDGPAAGIDDDTKYVDWPAIFGAVIISSASSSASRSYWRCSGLAVVSPWSYNNPSPTAMTVAGAAWFALSALYAGAVGGYIVGRLRKPALDATADERSNRDGLNALVTWGFGLLLTAALTTSILSSASGNGRERSRPGCRAGVIGNDQSVVQQGGRFYRVLCGPRPPGTDQCQSRGAGLIPTILKPRLRAF